MFASVSLLFRNLSFRLWTLIRQFQLVTVITFSRLEIVKRVQDVANVDQNSRNQTANRAPMDTLDIPNVDLVSVISMEQTHINVNQKLEGNVTVNRISVENIVKLVPKDITIFQIALVRKVL